MKDLIHTFTEKLVDKIHNPTIEICTICQKLHTPVEAPKLAA